VNGVIRRPALCRNKIMSNTVRSAAHAIPSVTQKNRIANWVCFPAVDCAVAAYFGKREHDNCGIKRRNSEPTDLGH
jgi:hypothetical protein